MPPRLATLRLLLVAVFAAATPSASSGGHGGRQEDYVVYLGHLPSTDDASGFSAVEAAHHDLLNHVLDDDGSSPSDRILRSYKRSLNGFAAKLTEQEAHKLSSMEGVVSIFPSRTHELLTTRSWDFLDFPQTAQEELPLQGEVIVGMLDTGVWPDSPSFSDEGFLEPPRRWKGACQNISCNKSCDAQSLAKGSYKGKVLLCPPRNSFGFPDDGSGPLLAGAAGFVTVSPTPDFDITPPLPGIGVSPDKFDEIVAYVTNTSNPTGTIESTMTTVDPKAPIVASFSSPGPNLITPGILKPDLSAPGIDIIASWSMLAPPSDDPNDKRRVQYNIDSGTSMACPHASGAAAYVKSCHRDWSPAMIMSALITTATPMDTPGNAGDNELKYGAGQLNPSKARDPGLVYDALERDYVAMLCAQGYNATQLAVVTGSNATSCTAGGGAPTRSGSDLNYPTMAARVEPGKNFDVSFPRTVTYVDGAVASAVYDAKVVLSAEAAKDIAVAVSPSKLEFSALGQKASFTVTVSGVVPAEGQVHSAAVVWYNEEHQVRSPLVMYAMQKEGV